MGIATHHEDNTHLRRVALDPQSNVEDQQIEHVVEKSNVQSKKHEQEDLVHKQGKTQKRNGFHYALLAPPTATKRSHHGWLRITEYQHHDDGCEQEDGKNRQRDERRKEISTIGSPFSNPTCSSCLQYTCSTTCSGGQIPKRICCRDGSARYLHSRVSCTHSSSAPFPATCDPSIRAIYGCDTKGVGGINNGCRHRVNADNAEHRCKYHEEQDVIWERKGQSHEKYTSHDE